MEEEEHRKRDFLSFLIDQLNIYMKLSNNWVWPA